MAETTYNRPDKYRLRRVSTRVEKALDELSRAVGETRPVQFTEIRATLNKAIAGLEKLAAQLDEIGVQPEPEPEPDEEELDTEANTADTYGNLDDEPGEAA